MKSIFLSQILTDEEIKKCLSLTSVQEIAREVIIPNLERINAVTGQENDPMYIAYAVDYARQQVQKLH